MNISENFEEIIRNFLQDELRWLEEEIDILYSSNTQKNSDQDRISANLILDIVMNHFLEWDNNELMERFMGTCENIKKKYPHLFK